MSEILHRWEWRTFGPHFGKAEAVLAELDSSGVQESDELYFLHGTGNNVKVRDALMDIKILLQVDPHGLEQWSPVMKQAFPLSRDDVSKVLQSLQMPIPSPMREYYTLDQLVADFAGPKSAVRAVNAHKRRVRYMVDGCMAELSDLTADGKSTRTIAVESEDPAAVIRAVEKLELANYRNTSYPRGLKALIDQQPPRFAVIDVGTNSIKFHLAERGDRGQWRSVVDRAELTRLGEGLEHKGAIGDAPLQRTIAAIAGMVEEATRNNAVAIMAVGTAGLRMAANRDQVLQVLHTRTGVRIEVISGEEEGRLAYLAARSGLGLKSGSLVAFDTGGGSSQFTFGRDSSVDEQFSVNVGAVHFTESFKLDDAVSPEVLRKATAAIAAGLSALDKRRSPDVLVAMGGAVTNIAAVKHRLAKYDPTIVQGTVLDVSEIDRQIELYRSRNADARRAVIGLQPKRAEVILAGACIVRTVMDKLGKKSLTVSDRGLRHGVLAERFGM